MDRRKTLELADEAATAFGPLCFSIRRMQKRDIPAVMAIERCSFPSPWPESAYLYELSFRRDSHFYVLQPAAVEENQASTWQRRLLGQTSQQHPILGYYGVRFPSGRAHLCTIAIHPDWRGRGLGQFALLCALDEAVRRGVETVTLEVRPSNTVAHRLYAKVGFTYTTTRREYYRDGEDAWVMCLAPIDNQIIARLKEMSRTVEDRLLNESLVHIGR